MKIQYFDVEGIPGVWGGPFAQLPKTYIAGKWITHYDLPRFVRNAWPPVSFQRFNELMADEMQLAAERSASNRQTTETQPPRADRA